jgi:diguanylate cyclase (GGDEF)-like protein
MGLQARIVLFVLATVLASHVGWGLYLSSEQEAHLMEDAAQHGQDVLRALAASCSVPLATRHVEDLDSILASFAMNDDWGRLDLLQVAILDAEGRVAAHSDPRIYGSVAEDEFTKDAVRSPEPKFEESRDGLRMKLSLPIVSGLRWGTATAVLSLERVEERVAELRRGVLLSGLVLTVAMAAVLYGLLAILALRPLKQLTDAVLRLSAGELDARAPKTPRTDEIAMLTDGFNEMAEKIQSNTRHLEEQVEVRTSALQSANAALERLARTDGLTGLANHRSLQERLAEEVARANRYDLPLSLLMIDVDHFKVYNDTNGHPQGDTVLARVGAILEERLRGSDLAARYGGEEFAVILPSTDGAAAASVARKLVQAVREQPFMGEASQPLGALTISVGGAELTLASETPAQLLVRADEHLYQAKSAGRDRVVFGGNEC